VLQFRHKAFLGTIENHPELESINRLLAKAEKGLLFQSDSRLLDSKIIHSSGFERFIALLDVLNKLSHTDDCRVLCGPAYTQNVKLKDYHRINEVYGYVADHFHSKISLEKIAGELHLNVSSFCRYFKKITKKSFFTYLNEYRVGKACDMLKRSDKRVAAICYESGFESIANFNRQFKKYIEMSPSAYRKHYSMKA
jgi:AraC-like DNA-binding protein